jgi:hypothetical protein
MLKRTSTAVRQRAYVPRARDRRFVAAFPFSDVRDVFEARHPLAVAERARA